MNVLQKFLTPIRCYFRKSLKIRLKIHPNNKDAAKIIEEFLKEEGER